MLTLDRGITSCIRLKGFGLVQHLVRKLGKNASYVMLIRYSIIPHCKRVKRQQTKGEGSSCFEMCRKQK